MNFLDRVAINTAIFDGHEIPESLAMIHDIGVSKVEFAFNQGYVGNLDDRLFSNSHADYLIDLLSHNLLSTDALGCTMDLAANQAVEGFKLRIRFAQRLGVRYLNTCTTRSANLSHLVKNLQQLAPYAEEHGCIICLENGGDSNFDAIATAQQGIRLLEQLDHKAVALNFDPGNTVSMCPDVNPAEEALVALPYCRHFHVKDVVASPQQYTFPAIGNGCIAYNEILRPLAASGIPFSLEIPMRMKRLPDATPNRSACPATLSDIKSTLLHSIGYIREFFDENTHSS